MADRYRPFEIPAYIALVGMVLAAWLGTQFNILMFMALPFLLVFFAAARRRNRQDVTISIAITMLGIFWIGTALVHAVLLRELPDHGAGLLVNVLVGTFACDTGAYAVGRMFGTHRFAPNLSPNKTIEGLVGGFLIGMLGVWCAGLYQDWLSGVDALILGAAVAAVAPIGDLFESMIKRDLDTKDTGNLFGPHGGLLDRLDAVFFTVVVGYYVSVALVY
jgi:phosphatidate cytidylyltransferase